MSNTIKNSLVLERITHIMSQKTSFYTTVKIDFCYKTYNSKREVEIDLDTEKYAISKASTKIRELALMTEPNKFFNNEANIYNQLTEEVDSLLNEIKDRTVNVIRLNLLLSKWDECHNEQGLGIDPPENLELNKSYIKGDFVYTQKYPDNKSILK